MEPPSLLVLIDAVIREQATQVGRRESMTFQTALDALYTSRFTGRVYLDFGQGVPTALSLPNPVQVRLER